MRRLSITAGIVALAATLAPVYAGAQTTWEPRPNLTSAQFEAFVGELGPMLRFRQVADATTLGGGRVELAAQFANMPFDAGKGIWTTAHDLGRSISYPQVVARFGASDRVDVGAWGGLDPRAKYGLVGVDTRIALVRQADGRPVSVLIRPSLGTLIYPSEVLVATVSVDASVSRTFGRWSPYAGVGGSTSGAVERSKTLDLDPATANQSFAFAGLSYRWQRLVLSAEVEKGARVNYAFRIGTRF